MEIDLRKIPTFVINRSSATTRRKHISEELEKRKFNYQIIEGIDCQPGYIGCALSHLKVLSQIHLTPPFIIFEDDCSFTDDFVPILDLPRETDCVYLGVSIWGMWPEIYERGIPYSTIATRYNSDFLQIHNMLSSHGIMYINDRLIKATCAKIVDNLIKPTNSDIAKAALQKDFIVLTPNRPFVYQDSRYGGHEKDTLLVLEPVSNIDGIKVNKTAKGFEIKKEKIAKLV
jgi:GR25 family glycosyltransferase involved in LPS biosynthesis